MKLRDKEIEKGRQAQPTETGKGDTCLGEGPGAEEEPREEKTDTRRGQEAWTAAGPQGAWGPGRTDRQVDGLRGPQSEGKDSPTGRLVGRGRGEGQGCPAAGHQKREARPFPTWGANLVLHTQGTEGIMAKPPGLPATRQLPPPLTLSHPGAKPREPC